MNGLWWFVVKCFAILFVVGEAIIYPIVYLCETKEERKAKKAERRIKK